MHQIPAHLQRDSCVLLSVTLENLERRVWRAELADVSQESVVSFRTTQFAFD